MIDTKTFVHLFMNNKENKVTGHQKQFVLLPINLSTNFLSQSLNTRNTCSINFLSRQVRRKIRNPWAHCDFTKWDAVKYADSFQLMEKLVKDLSLSSNEEIQIIGEMKKWEINGNKQKYKSFKLKQKFSLLTAFGNIFNIGMKYQS